ncbi:MAG TPA: toll/interleukin-1 receptor domain-containing protein [Longimicrobium sp.]|nr:toll/interleukin-1 receptor domain-containing protein [Longimicrobium sp.]
MTSKPLVYISYSLEDLRFVEQLLIFLRPYIRSGEFETWDDGAIAVGGNWQPEMDQAIDRADVAIVLVSPTYLAQSSTEDHELHRLLERQKEGGLRILPLIVLPSAWAHTPLVYLPVWPRNGRALDELSELQRNRVWVDFTESLLGIVHGLRNPGSQLALPVTPAAAEPTSRPARQTRQARSDLLADDDGGGLGRTFFISHAREDGDFAENLKGRMAQRGFTGWIDIDILEAGVDWRTEIDRALLQSCAVILVLSPDSKASEYVTYEWAYGLGLGRSIVPLLLRETPIHPRLEPFQYLDFTNRAARPWDRLFTRLGELSKGVPATTDTRQRSRILR